MRSARGAGRRICGLREAAGRPAGGLDVGIFATVRIVIGMGLTIHGYHKHIFHISKAISARLRSRRIAPLPMVILAVDRDPEVRRVHDKQACSLQPPRLRGAGPIRRAISLANMAILWWSNGRQTLIEPSNVPQGFD